MFIKHLYIEVTQGAIRIRKSKDNEMNKRKRTKGQTIAHRCMEEMKNVHVFIFIFFAVGIQPNSIHQYE